MKRFFILLISFPLFSIGQNIHLDPVNYYHFATPCYFPKETLTLRTNWYGSLDLPFRINDGLIKDSNDSLIVSPSNVFSELGESPNLYSNIDIELLFIGLKVGYKKDYFISASSNLNSVLNIRGNKSVLGYIINGNSNYLGQNISQSEQGMGHIVYLSRSFGCSKKINESIYIGLKVNYLKGLSNFFIDRFNLYLNSNYPEDGSPLFTKIQTDILIHSTPFSSNSSSNNRGISSDIGFSYKKTNLYQVTASINNIGFISWRDKTQSLRNDTLLVLESLINSYDDLTNLSNEEIESYVDSASQYFFFDTLSTSINHRLPKDVFFSFDYFINQANTFSFNLHSQLQNNNIYSLFNLSYLKRLNNFFRLNLDYNIIDKSFNNLGVGITLCHGNTSIHINSFNIFSNNLLNFEKMAFNWSIKIGFNTRKKDPYFPSYKLRI